MRQGCNIRGGSDGANSANHVGAELRDVSVAIAVESDAAWVGKGGGRVRAVGHARLRPAVTASNSVDGSSQPVDDADKVVIAVSKKQIISKFVDGEAAAASQQRGAAETVGIPRSSAALAAAPC